ncbi:stage II sporulation protein R [Ectobacillus antri]|uniref:Stage II sporulation protein R n=1 Tax=Ectobacillus antri TaxID=2486280 RepID=A0ABT6H731_9BACI|nr:stage II sporulation protein R [Ectobacillus antri]MDG4657636.1 stage II sporulation protein R [Ectobacillus antri]MDG5754643.1 stage II sporulation protein R [Ectobacillus antri]
MKKQVIAFLILLVIGAQFMAHFGYMQAEAKVIPNEAIRLRILANSDSNKDQALKRKVRDEVKAQIDGWVAELTSIEDARTIIQSRIPELEKTVAKVLKEEKSNQSYKVEFGKQVKFPTKQYGNFLYPAGEYEAVLVTLGAGEGANWWCVLFPPLCFLDFASGTAIKKQQVKEEPVEEEKVVEEVEEVEEVKTEKPVVQKTNEKTVAKVQTKKKDTQRLEKEEKLIEQVVAAVETESVEEPEDKVEIEEEPEVKFFFVEVVTSLFSK